MTVIVYRDGVLAADGLATSDGVVPSTEAKKLVRLTDGRVAGMMGTAWCAQKLVEWIEDGEKGDQPKADNPNDDATVIVLSAEGLTAYEMGHRELLSPAPYRAFGCGARIALGALAMGASAPVAVKMACDLDVYCGGEITAMQL